MIEQQPTKEDFILFDVLLNRCGALSAFFFLLFITIQFTFMVRGNKYETKIYILYFYRFFFLGYTESCIIDGCFRTVHTIIPKH